MAGSSGISSFGSSSPTAKPMANAETPAGKWSAQSNPYQAAYDFFTNPQTGKDASGKDVDTAAQAAKKMGVFPSSFDKVSQKFNDGLKDLYKQNLSPDDFKKKEKALYLTCTPRPGLKQQYMAQLTNLNNLQKSGKLSKADFAKEVDKLQNGFGPELQSDAYVDQQCCNVDSFDYQDACSKYNEAMKAAQDG